MVTLFRVVTTLSTSHINTAQFSPSRPPTRPMAVLCKRAVGSTLLLPTEAELVLFVHYYFCCYTFSSHNWFMSISCFYSCVCPEVQSSDGRVGVSHPLSRQGSKVTDHPCFRSLGWAGSEEYTNQRTYSPCLPQTQVHTAHVFVWGFVLLLMRVCL